MIVLFTDFGLEGPYVGQMKAVLAREAPGVAIIDLFANAPAFDPVSSAYLLAAYADAFPRSSIFLCVVDPGVGGPRAGVVLYARGRYFVGPDNGLFNRIALDAADARWWEIEWNGATPSASFHGRDVFAPVAARLARGEQPPWRTLGRRERELSEWPANLERIVYVDHYGNALTGVFAEHISLAARLAINGRELPRVRTFSDVPVGDGLCYENANGLMEVAVNQGVAARDLGLGVGSPVRLVD